MNRSDVAQLEVSRIAEALDNGDLKEQWTRLADLAGNEAALILKLVCRVSPSDCADSLRGLETAQTELGAGFLGMLPDQIPDELESPTDLSTSLSLAIQLANIRAANLEALVETLPHYPLTFAGNSPQLELTSTSPADWVLDVDVSGIRAVLDFFDAENPDEPTAKKIAQMPAFTEMMRHRRELGYVPEPLINADGLAWCLMQAASREPIIEIWKWLHPQNLFDLSDLYNHRAQYRKLIDQLTKGDGLANYILGQIAPFAPAGIRFDDRLSFAVGWGIRGWATTKSGGLNIEHTKDAFSEMLPTLVHETFHRLQTQIAFADPTIDEAGFDRITSYPFEEIADTQLYQALCYIMLEGSATYVASHDTEQTWLEDATAGIEILNRISDLGMPLEEDERFDELLTEGLRSNGPFYGFGALLSHAIVEGEDQSKLGQLLGEGAPAFIEEGFRSLAGSAIALSPKLADSVHRIRMLIAKG